MSAAQAILITGASSGTGKATALYLDEQGYTVYTGARNSLSDLRKAYRVGRIFSKP